MKEALFDSWTEQYDQWFETPGGVFVRKYEADLLLRLLNPQAGEHILDVGCGTGIFTQDVLGLGSRVTGIDLSFAMLAKARDRGGRDFNAACSNMCALPFADQTFDRAFSMTAIEFVEDISIPLQELQRVTKKGGCLVVTTLNKLSPWAVRREKEGREGHSLFSHAYFRTPDDMRKLVKGPCTVKTAVHFMKDSPVADIPGIENEGMKRNLQTGALLAVQWQNGFWK
ncbi:class I SAM-dependent methyltransferase [Desulfogranum japonicum]|uniref:class I SAM-dependent methyltransferase n=1 Tax=Desulfogranum japonicum TaxID=231447 RepID=UPI0003FF0CEB|nr:class I SAM-dependent methyltransferase [Desulfogranum japonicum]